MKREKEDFYDMFKRFAEKTEDLIDGQVTKLKEKGVIDDVEGYINKTGDFVGKKIVQFKKSEMAEKAEKVLKKVQDTGDKISEKVEGIIDNFENEPSKESQKSNEREAGFPKKI